jgi:hypothetical protein
MGYKTIADRGQPAAAVESEASEARGAETGPGPESAAAESETARTQIVASKGPKDCSSAPYKRASSDFPLQSECASGDARGRSDWGQ